MTAIWYVKITAKDGEGSLVVKADELDLGGFALSEGGWSAKTVDARELDVAGVDQLAHVASISLADGGEAVADGLALTLRLRTDGYLDVPTGVADIVPDYWGGYQTKPGVAEFAAAVAGSGAVSSTATPHVGQTLLT